MKDLVLQFNPVAEAETRARTAAAEHKLLELRVAEAEAEAKAAKESRARKAAAEQKLLEIKVAEAEEARGRKATAPPPCGTADGPQQLRDQDIGPAVMNEMLMQAAAWAGYKDKAC